MIFILSAGNHSPAHSDAATTTRASSVSEHHNNTMNHTGTMGKINRAYQRYYCYLFTDPYKLLHLQC